MYQYRYSQYKTSGFTEGRSIKLNAQFSGKRQTYQADDVDKNPRIRDCNFGSSFSISLLKIGEIDTRHEQKLPTGVLLHVED